MRGEVLSFDETAGTGLISGDDGLRYAFDVGGLIGAASVQPGQRVDFVATDGMASQVMVLAAAAAAPQAAMSSGVTGAGSDVIDWNSLFLKFDGRIRRSHFWIGWIILFVAGIILGMIPFLGFVIGLVMIWPNLAIVVKRLHDMGQTGWLAAVPYVVAVVGSIVAFSMMGFGALVGSTQYYESDPAAALAIIGPAFGVFGLMFLIGLGFLLWIGLTPGTPGTNKYGPNPKGE